MCIHVSSINIPRLFVFCFLPFPFFIIFILEKVGWSDGRRGGWLLSALHDVFRNRIAGKKRFSLMEALVEVNRMVELLYESKSADDRYDGMKSIPCMEYKLTQEIYLEPKVLA